MLDQTVINLLSTLLGGLLTVVGGLLGSFLLQKMSDNTNKRKEIRNIIEHIYKKTQDIDTSNLKIRDKRQSIDVEHEAAEVDKALDYINMLVTLYLSPLEPYYRVYRSETKIFLEAVIKTHSRELLEKFPEGHFEAINKNFRDSLTALLKAEGYNFF